VASPVGSFQHKHLNLPSVSASISSTSTISQTRPASGITDLSGRGETERLQVFSFCSGRCSDLAHYIVRIWSDFVRTLSTQIYRFQFLVKRVFGLSYPEINYDLSKEKLRNLYWGLGKEGKWRECIDGRYHHLGKHVFDTGAHKGTVEPGFIASMEQSFPYVEKKLGQKIDSDWYLGLHKLTCAHFNGDPTVYLMGQEKVGVFRNTEDNIHCGLNGAYSVSTEAKAEFDALDAELKRELGADYGLGTMTYTSPLRLDVSMAYKPMSRDQVKRVFDRFLNAFYAEVEGTASPDAKLLAIARLHQRLEWLHPVRDGTARTSTDLLNKHLTDYGFHPAILEYPHVSSSYTLQQWKEYLKNGLLKWELERDCLESV
jgi:Fic/DOC family